MADRHDYDRDRYGAGPEYGRDRDPARGEERWRRERSDERGMLERASDEVRSWFGDDEAVRRRRSDEHHEGHHERGWRRGAETDRDYQSESGPGRAYGRQYGAERGYAAGEEPGRASRSFTADRGWSRERQAERPGSSWSMGERERSWPGRGGTEGSRTEAWGTSPDWGTASDWGVTRDDRLRTEGGYSASFLGWMEPGPYSGRGPRDYRRSDERIREDVCDRLTRHGRIDATDVRVQVSNGEVTLDGTVASRDMKRLAEDVAEDVDGVHDVINHLKTNRGETAATQQ